MTQTSILSDEMLRQFMAVGQVDVLVGLPTLDNHGTVADIVRAAHATFANQFARERTVLLNLDGGSTDGTPEIVRDASLSNSDMLSASHVLRTMHRISTPYHGLPGKGSALRLIFAAADLLQAKAVAVLDADLKNPTSEGVASLIRPALREGVDYVAPRYARHPLDGPLVTQLVRPLTRATYGWQLQEPVGGELGCSGRFATHCVEQRVWDSEIASYGTDVWLAAEAMAGGFRLGQAALGPRTAALRTAAPGLPEVFRQIVGAVFACLKIHTAYWHARAGSEPVPTFGTPQPATAEHHGLDVASLAEGFREAVPSLAPVLQPILSAETLAELRRVADTPDRLVFPDELWVRVVYEFAAASNRAVMHQEHVVQALVSVYLGRTAAFVRDCAGRSAAEIEASLEALCLRYEQLKPYLIERWNSERER